jgi:hypothetical protein
MGGLKKICKVFGSMTVSANGKTVTYEYDYANDIPRPKGEMTKEEKAASEKARWNKNGSEFLER